MICHYEVFNLPLSCSADEIKKQYRKLALQYHPDKNVGNEVEATESFKAVQSAYAVLSDPQERKWYDDHRESILKGGDGIGKSVSDDVVDLWPYFSQTCYSGDPDDSKGFNTVYRTLFEELSQSELKNSDNEDDSGLLDAPNFGDSNSTSKEFLLFYNYWTSFSSRMTFSWEDKYNPNDATNRQVRRTIEKENKKLRDVGRKEYNEQVRQLVNFIRKRDIRVIKYEEEIKIRREELENNRLLKKVEIQMKRKEIREYYENDENEIKLRENERKGAFLLADLSDDDAITGDKYNDIYCDSDDQDIMNKIRDASINNDNNEESEEIGLEVCNICEKEFKTSIQLSQHLLSKNHRKKVQEVEKKNKKNGIKVTSSVDGAKKNDNEDISSSTHSSQIKKSTSKIEMSQVNDDNDGESDDDSDGKMYNTTTKSNRKIDIDVNNKKNGKGKKKKSSASIPLKSKNKFSFDLMATDSENEDENAAVMDQLTETIASVDIKDEEDGDSHSEPAKSDHALKKKKKSTSRGF